MVQKKSLYSQIKQLKEVVGSLFNNAEYGPILKELASIKEPVDAFFDNVMVMVDNEALKSNRLALLIHLQELLQEVADISMLQLQYD